jgi:peroxiredoxin Q/BCP
MLKAGDTAPAFTLTDQDGQAVSLSDLSGRKVFVWFYPKANTPGCTAEGCTLRDQAPEFDAKGIEIVGVSMDSVRKLKNFATKHSFPYRLLSDPEGVAVHGFGAWGRKKFMGKEYDGILRSSFLIDAHGVIERVWAKVKTKSHASDVLAELS